MTFSHGSGTILEVNKIHHPKKGGEKYMTNTMLLRETIKKSGLKYRYIAQTMGITPYGLSKKINGETEFKASEIVVLTDVLGLNDTQRDNIFFDQKSELKSLLPEGR